MGCDIHIYREAKREGKWVSVDKWTPFDYGEDEKGVHVEWGDRAYTGRNYDLFGLLASGVRGRDEDFSFEQRGTPFNMSLEVAAAVKQWDCDGHSHSYLYLDELRDMAAHLATATVQIEGVKDRAELAVLRASIESGSPDWSLIYPYSAAVFGAGADKYEKFAFDVPAAFALGEGVQKIIESFAGIEGDNHRIVFFFDN